MKAWLKALLLMMFLLPVWVQAGTCFVIDDDLGIIITYDSDPPYNQRFATTIVTPTWTPGLVTPERFESAYFDSVSNRYYVVYQATPNVFGYVRPNDGVFVPLSPTGTGVGSGNGPNGTITPSGNGTRGIRGLARNPIDGKWYIHDFEGYIFQINPITGVIVPGAFGGNDYVRARTPTGGTFGDAEDFAFDNSGNLFMVRNDPGANQFLRNIDLTTGFASSAIDLFTNEAEGLSNSLGDIRLIIGAGGGTNARKFYSVNTATGGLTLLFTVPEVAAPETSDFESTGCNDGVPRADLRLSKTVSPSAVAPGGTVTFTLRLEHEGIDIAHRIQVQETLPAGMAVISSSQGPGCTLCSYDIPSGVWSVDKIDIGQVRTVTLVASTTGVTPNSFVDNRAQISQVCDSATGPCVALLDVDSTQNNKAGSIWTPTEDDEVIASLLVTVNPSVAKAFSPTTGLAGATTTLVFTFTNANTTASATITSVFTDTYPTGLVNSTTPTGTTTCAGTGAITATAGANSISLGAGRVIAANSSCQLLVVVTASSIGNYTNTVAVGVLTATIPGLTLTNVVGATGIYQITPDNVGVIKQFTPSGIGSGQTSTLRLTFSNPRNVTATLLSTFVDTYPTNLFNSATPNPQTNCVSGVAAATAGGTTVTLSTGAQIPPGGSCTMTAVVTSSVIGVYTNTVAPGSLSTSVGYNYGTASSSLLVANPSVSKAFIPDSIVPGADTLLVLTFTNPRSTTATFSTAFTDTYPTGLFNDGAYGAAGDSNTCGGGVTAANNGTNLVMNTTNRIPPFSSCVVTKLVDLNSGSATGTFVNTVPTGSLSTSLGTNASAATATLTVAALTNLSVTKVVSAANIFPGTTLTYTVTVTNLGPNVAFNARLTDVLESASLFGPVTSTFSGTGSLATLVTSTTGLTATMTLPINGIGTFTFRATPGVANGFITNTASVLAGPTGTDAILSNNETSVNTLVSPSAALSISKTNGVSTVSAGGTTVYTVTFVNSGPSDASGALVRDFPSSNLINCSVLSCNGTGGANCGTPTFTALNTSGYSLPSFPSGSTVTLRLQCSVNSTGL